MSGIRAVRRCRDWPQIWNGIQIVSRRDVQVSGCACCDLAFEWSQIKVLRPPSRSENVATLFVYVGESRFENVTDLLPRAAVELNKSQLFDRAKVRRSSADFDP
jgi:hypothetical protein